MGVEPTFVPEYIAPGLYVQQQDVSTPRVSSGTRIPAAIGQGAKTLLRTETLTKGAKNGTDGPLTNTVAIDIITLSDEDNVVYTKGTDFNLIRSGSDALVDWGLTASITGTVDLTTLTYPGDLEGLKLKLTIDGGTPNPIDQTVTFSGVVDPADVASQINAWHVSLAGVASVVGDRLVLSANSVIIEEGNANAVLGYITGDSASVKEPATAKTYRVNYTSDKTTAEFKPRLFSNMNDAILFNGPLLAPTVLFSGTATAGGADTLDDTSKAFGVNTLRGNYVRITAGPGKGQVRVIMENTATSVQVSEAWNTANPPGAGSSYQITDVNENSISQGGQDMFDAGGTFLITSQYRDDLFDSSNIKLAYDNLKEDVSGFRPECLVLMRGVGSSEDSILIFIKDHVVEMSNVANNKFRVAVIGFAQGVDDFTVFTQKAESLKERRVTLININTIQKDYGTGQGLLSLDGSHVAAGYAGIYCAAVDSGEPIIRKSLGAVFDVDTFSDPFRENEKNQMARAGVTIIERQGIDIRIRQDLTTDNSTVFSHIAKHTRIADDISNTLKRSLEAVLTGRRFVESPTGTEDVVALAKSSLVFILNSFRNPLAQRITKFENLSVERNPTSPNQLDIKVDITVTTDVVWTFALLGFKV